jgi:hypothetical protein
MALARYLPRVGGWVLLALVVLMLVRYQGG